MIFLKAAVATAAFLAAGAAMAMQQPAPAPAQDFSQVTVHTTDLGNKTYWLEMVGPNGQMGGNVAAVVGTDCIIMVDSNFAPMADKIKAAVAAVSPLPIKFLINTHFHGDHTGGNAAFAAGATIVAHENVRKRLAEGTVNGLSGARAAPVAADALPKDTYPERTMVRVGGRTAVVGHPLNAHTDGDSYVRLEDANVLATGDTVTFGRYPNIDFANGGGINGMVTATETYLQLTNDQTKIIPGHGPLGNKATLMEYRQMLMTSRERVQKLIAEGKTEAEVVAAKPNADYDAKYNANDMQAGNFMRVIYRSLKPA